ncbi:hypothetical protein [Gordonia sp. SL306]|uniref:hypothetical protein n=1 Tax=Gordonia sp. SL306 TaxID=2995145 RepID=UPI00226E7960|nr:hypothetical protein [Gordonia sp. SL306]WAC54534.1 hypothetical protein OVA31_17970 [Gordonia sp. SL306]
MVTPTARRTAWWLAATATVSVIAACGTGDGQDTPTSSSASPTPTASAHLDAAECTETPESGRIDRTGADLDFRSGALRVAMVDSPATDRDNPAGAPASAEVGDGDTECLGFSKWGNPRPEVPPDTLLFVFKGPGTDGAQLEFLASDLTGGVLPPIGSTRPTVGPLSKPINAAVGVSVDGAYYHSNSCPLKITAMSSRRAAASFTCQRATRNDANPFAPDDDVTYDADESTPASPSTATSSTTPTAIGSPTGVTLSGWFELTP